MEKIDDEYVLSDDLSGLKINENGIITPIPFFWPSTVECEQCEEQCFEPVWYTVIKGKIRAHLVCYKGEIVWVRRAVIEREMDRG